MSLDISKLENVREKPDKTTARCPACAACGRDNKGDHLVIYPDGRFGCVVHPQDAEHRKRIWRLAGQNNNASVHHKRPPRFTVRQHPDRGKWQTASSKKRADHHR